MLLEHKNEREKERDLLIQY